MSTHTDNRLAEAKARLRQRKIDAGMDVAPIEGWPKYVAAIGDSVYYTDSNGYRASGTVVGLDDGTVKRQVRIDNGTVTFWVGLANVRLA